jgi:hypothetical protein
MGAAVGIIVAQERYTVGEDVCQIAQKPTWVTDDKIPQLFINS